jgi:fructose-1,6-bisphosphatase/inositol monophosphatase family enzyme
MTGIAVTSGKLEGAVLDLRSADVAGAFGFATGKGAVCARVDGAVMEQAGCVESV